MLQIKPDYANVCANRRTGMLIVSAQEPSPRHIIDVMRSRAAAPQSRFDRKLIATTTHNLIDDTASTRTHTQR